MRKIYRVYAWTRVPGHYVRFKSSEFDNKEDAEQFVRVIVTFFPRLGAPMLSSNIHEEDVPSEINFIDSDCSLFAISDLHGRK